MRKVIKTKRNKFMQSGDNTPIKEASNINKEANQSLMLRI
jgi:hypothetical protein